MRERTGPRSESAPAVFLASCSGNAPPDRRPTATKWPSDSVTPIRTGPWGINSASRGTFMYKASKQYLTVSVSALVVAILFLLAAILVRSVVAPEMGGKIAADGTALELKKSLP